MFRGTAGQTLVAAKTGSWSMSIPKLDTLVAGAGYGTGDLKIEIVSGDVPHTDSQRIAWGPVADADVRKNRKAAAANATRALKFRVE